jgi:hypothetical protein
MDRMTRMLAGCRTRIRCTRIRGAVFAVPAIEARRGPT